MAMDLSGFVRKKTTIKINTKEFIFTELSIGDLAEFKSYLVERKERLNKARRDRIIADAQKIGGVDSMELLKFSDSQVTEEEFGMEMESIEGIGYLAYLSLKYHYPEISKEQASEIVNTSCIEDVTKAMFPVRTETEADEKKTTHKKSPKPQQ